MIALLPRVGESASLIRVIQSQPSLGRIRRQLPHPPENCAHALSALIDPRKWGIDGGLTIEIFFWFDTHILLPISPGT